VKKRNVALVLASAVVVLSLIGAGVALVVTGSGGARGDATVDELQVEPTSVEAPSSVEPAGTTVQVLHANWGSGDNEVGLSDNKEVGPTSFFVAPDGTVYVVDAWNKRILVFSSDGVVTEEIPLSEALEPYDMALTCDGSFLIYDPGSFSFQLYDPEGHLLSKLTYGYDFCPGWLETAGDTICAWAGWDGPDPGKGYFSLYENGKLLDLDLDKPMAKALNPAATLPLQDGAVSFAETKDGGWDVVATVDGAEVMRQTLEPAPGGSLRGARLADGRVVVAGFASEPTLETPVLRHRAWVIDASGKQASFDLGSEETTVGYVHVRTRVTDKGEVYFMNTDVNGLTIWKTMY